MVVQHNLKAMNSNRMLGITQSTQAKSTEKLSSGYKINRAADDAAGLSISEKMRKQIRGLTQASTNAQDGISAVQTAEGALNEVQDMLQRMNELAVKAANGTNSEDDRNYIQDEIKQLTTEIDRVAETTKFNETYLLKGDRDATPKTKYQYSTDTIDKLSQDLYYVSNNAVQTLTRGTYIDDIDSAVPYYSNRPAATVGEALTSANSGTYIVSAAVLDDTTTYYKKVDNNYVQVDAGSKIDQATYYTGSYDPNAEVQSLTSVASASVSATANVVADNKEVFDNQNVHYTAGQVVTADYDSYMINSGKASFLTAESASVNLAEYTESTPPGQLMDKDGNEIAANGLYRFFDETGAYKGGLYKSTDKNSEIAADSAEIKDFVNDTGKYSTGALTLKLHVGADATDNNQIVVELDAMSAESLGVNGLDVSGTNDEKARNAIETIKEALQRVSTQRSALGAVQNRLEHTIANLDNVVENTTSAESGIRDTDMATEMVKYSNNNILAQAGQAMLAQANQSNQGVLSLLG